MEILCLSSFGGKKKKHHRSDTSGLVKDSSHPHRHEAQYLHLAQGTQHALTMRERQISLWRVHRHLDTAKEQVKHCFCIVRVPHPPTNHMGGSTMSKSTVSAFFTQACRAKVRDRAGQYICRDCQRLEMGKKKGKKKG